MLMPTEALSLILIFSDDDGVDNGVDDPHVQEYRAVR